MVEGKGRGGTQRGRAHVILLLHLLHVVGSGAPHEPSSPDTSSSTREACLQIVDPQPGYALTPEDHVSMPFILRVNCAGLQAVSHLRLDSEPGFMDDGGGWWGPEDLLEMGLAEHAGWCMYVCLVGPGQLDLIQKLMSKLLHCVMHCAQAHPRSQQRVRENLALKHALHYALKRALDRHARQSAHDNVLKHAA